MYRKHEALLRNLIRNTLQTISEEKPGGGLTDLGAKRRIARSDALSQMRSEIEAADGDVPKAAQRLDVSPSTLYLAIQQEPSLEKSKEKADKDAEDMASREDKSKDKKESRLRWNYYNMLLEATDGPPPLPPPPNYKEKIMAKLASAGEDGIGMMTKPAGSGGVSVVLYKTNVFVGNILASLDTEKGAGGDTQAIADATEKSIIGMISIDKAEDTCNGAMEVKVVFAKEGYGPTLYEIAMQLSPSGRIISDRHAVSKNAEKMYRGLHARGDIEKKPLDDNSVDLEDRKTPDPSDDCETWDQRNEPRPNKEFLDYSFGGGSADLATLKKNNKEMMSILNKHVTTYLGWSESFASDYLSQVANYMFMKIYHEIPVEDRGWKSGMT